MSDEVGKCPGRNRSHVAQHCVAAALEEAKAVCVERGAAAEGFVSDEHTVRNQRGLPQLPRGVSATGRSLTRRDRCAGYLVGAELFGAALPDDAAALDV